MIVAEYRYQVHTYDADDEFIATYDTTGGLLTLELDRLDEAGGRPVRFLRIREYERPCPPEEDR